MSRKPKKANGRPSEFTEALAETICARLATGESLRSICEDEDMPGKTTVFRWLFSVEGFRDQYARARELQSETYVDEIVEIADDGRNDFIEKNDPDNPGYRENGEAMRRSQIRIEARKWHASKLAAKKYGDKVDLTHGSDPARPVVHEIVRRIVAPQSGNSDS
jgi:hypothetical protein